MKNHTEANKIDKSLFTKTNPIKMPTWTCINCARVYKEMNAYITHRQSSDCTLKTHTAQDLHEAAQTAYNNIITKYVHTYYTSILEAVAKGKFTCTLAFDYTDTDRRTLLTEVVTRLQKKFDGVVFTRHFDSSGFTADWSSANRLTKTEKYIKAFQELNSSKSAWPQVRLKDIDWANLPPIKELYDDAFVEPQRRIIILTTKDTESDPPFTYFT